jgi:GNAT superfamily N-acetyltransferase
LWRVEDLLVRQLGTADPLVAEEFEAPHGAWIELMTDGEPVAGGAFRRHDGETAEFERIWTTAAHRRRGLGRRVVAELEILAAVRGYRRIRLSTRRQEARAFCLATGYAPTGPQAFEKLLPAHNVPVQARP